MRTIVFEKSGEERVGEVLGFVAGGHGGCMQNPFVRDTEGREYTVSSESIVEANDDKWRANNGN